MTRPPSGTARRFSPRRPNWPRALSAELRNSLAVIRVPSAARRRRPPRMHPRRTKCIAPPKRTESTPTAFSFPPFTVQTRPAAIRVPSAARRRRSSRICPCRTARSAPSKGTKSAPTASNPRLSPSITGQRDLHSLCREQPACCNSRSLRHATSPLQTPGAAVCMKPPRPHSKIHSPRANHSSSLHALSALKPFGICLIPINMRFLGTKSSLELQISPLFALFREFQNPRLGCAVSARRAYPSPCSLPRGRPPARRHCAPAPAARWFQ